MNEYIEKGALYDALWDAKEEKSVKSLKDVFDFLDKFPAEDVQAVKWISVEDKLPEDRHWVLVFDTGYATPKKAKYKEEGFFVFDGSCENSVEITHWMPLPEPPKKEGANNGN